MCDERISAENRTFMTSVRQNFGPDSVDISFPKAGITIMTFKEIFQRAASGKLEPVEVMGHAFDEPIERAIAKTSDPQNPVFDRNGQPFLYDQQKGDFFQSAPAHTQKSFNLVFA